MTAALNTPMRCELSWGGDSIRDRASSAGGKKLHMRRANARLVTVSAAVRPMRGSASSPFSLGLTLLAPNSNTSAAVTRLIGAISTRALASAGCAASGIDTRT